MKRELVIPLLLSSCLFFGSPASASDKHNSEWATLDTVLQISYAAVHVADWRLTLKGTENGHLEDNHFLGKRPSNAEINRYFAATLVGHTLVAYLLPKPYRTIFQAGTIGMQISVIDAWYSAGMRVTF